MTGLASSAFFAFGTLLVLFGTNGTEIVERLGIDDEGLGLVGSMLSLGLGVGILVAGPLVDRMPRRPLFLFACGIVVLSSTTIGPWTDFSMLLVHSAAIGFGAGFYETVLNTLVVERAGPRASRHLLFIHSAATLGAALTPLAVGGLRGIQGQAFIESFRLAGGLHVAIALIAFAIVMQRPGRDQAKVARPIPEKGGGGDPATLAAICVATFVYVGVETALTIFVARHARIELGLDAIRADAAISAFWSGLLVGRLVAGLLPRAPGAGSVAAMATAAGGVIAAFAGGWLREPELAMALAGLALGHVFPILIALAGPTLPGRTGTAVGLAASMGSLGGFVIPWVAGRIATAADLGTAFFALAASMALLAGSAGLAALRRAPARHA
jgi:FHS family glucose/mannose:H+ symporter-like MFS transporter